MGTRFLARAGIGLAATILAITALAPVAQAQGGPETQTDLRGRWNGFAQSQLPAVQTDGCFFEITDQASGWFMGALEIHSDPVPHLFPVSGFVLPNGTIFGSGGEADGDTVVFSGRARVIGDPNEAPPSPCVVMSLLYAVFDRSGNLKDSGVTVLIQMQGGLTWDRPDPDLMPNVDGLWPGDYTPRAGPGGGSIEFDLLQQVSGSTTGGGTTGLTTGSTTGGGTTGGVTTGGGTTGSTTGGGTTGSTTGGGTTGGVTTGGGTTGSTTGGVTTGGGTTGSTTGGGTTGSTTGGGTTGGGGTGGANPTTAFGGATHMDQVYVPAVQSFFDITYDIAGTVGVPAVQRDGSMAGPFGAIGVCPSDPSRPGIIAILIGLLRPPNPNSALPAVQGQYRLYDSFFDVFTELYFGDSTAFGQGSFSIQQGPPRDPPG